MNQPPDFDPATSQFATVRAMHEEHKKFRDASRAAIEANAPRLLHPPLQCCVCGEQAGRFKQWPNRDTGYGVCRPCALGHSESDRLDLFGREGINWASDEQWAKIGAA